MAKKTKNQLMQNSDESFIKTPQEELGFMPMDSEKRYQFETILRNILPYLGSDEGKIVLTQVMIILKLEGIIGKQWSPRDSKMVHFIKESILMTPKKKQEALKLAQNLLKSL